MLLISSDGFWPPSTTPDRSRERGTGSIAGVDPDAEIDVVPVGSVSVLPVRPSDERGHLEKSRPVMIRRTPSGDIERGDAASTAVTLAGLHGSEMLGGFAVAGNVPGDMLGTVVFAGIRCGFSVHGVLFGCDGWLHYQR